MLAIVFSSFNFHMYLKSSVMLTYILWQKSLVWFLKRSLNEPLQYRSISYLVYWMLIPLLYIQCLLLNIYYQVDIRLCFNNCIHITSWLNNSSIVGSNDWAPISTATITQLNRFLLKIFDILWCFGKWQFINSNFLPIFVFTIFENGGLNHVILRLHFLIF